MHPAMMPERRRLLDRLIREIYRGEVQAAEHATRREKLIGAVAAHSRSMRERFDAIVRGYDPQTGRAGFSATLSSLRGLVSDRMVDPERMYRTCLLDLRHGLDVVKLAREVARSEELFGIIRWCDDYLGARRTLVARVEAQLVWFVEQAGIDLIPPTLPPAPIAEPVSSGTPIAGPETRHEQEEVSPEHRLGVHPSRTT